MEENIFALHDEILAKQYRHGQYESFYVRDPKLRHIHKASVRDRVVHQALFRVLYHVFDSGFIFDSYSCRLNKGTHAGVNRLVTFARRASANNRKSVFVLKCDIKKFFDSVDKDILLGLIKRRVEDTDTRWLVRQILDSFETRPGKGLPLGNVTSQLFANIYLNELDQFVKRTLREKFYIRYCDDFLILHESRDYLEQLIPIISNFLKTKLQLTLHPEKIIIRKYSQGADFLGYVVRPYYKILRTKTKKRMLRRIEKETGKTVLDRTLPSYFGMLSHCRGYKIKKRILVINAEKMRKKLNC